MFQQAPIKIEKVEEFEELKAALARIFAPEQIHKFLKNLESNGIRIRDFESVLAKKLLEKLDRPLAESGKTAQRLYQGLTLSDQGQMREFYLTKVETVDLALREKFNKLYRYY